MERRIQEPEVCGGSLESVITKLRGLSPESQATVASVINRLTLAEIVSSRV